MATMLTVTQLHKRHHAENPSSQLGLRAIKTWVRSGELPSIKVGNRNLVELSIFERFLKGELDG